MKGSINVVPIIIPQTLHTVYIKQLPRPPAKVLRLALLLERHFRLQDHLYHLYLSASCWPGTSDSSPFCLSSFHCGPPRCLAVDLPLSHRLGASGGYTNSSALSTRHSIDERSRGLLG